MRAVKWEDKDGWKHRSLVRDDDPDSAAPGGIPQDPPNIRELDWEGVMRDINNAFVDQEILTWADVQRTQTMKNIATSAIKRRLIALFRG